MWCKYTFRGSVEHNYFWYKKLLEKMRWLYIIDYSAGLSRLQQHHEYTGCWTVGCVLIVPVLRAAHVPVMIPACQKALWMPVYACAHIAWVRGTISNWHLPLQCFAVVYKKGKVFITSSVFEISISMSCDNLHMHIILGICMKMYYFASLL